MKRSTPKKKNKGFRGYKSHGWGSKKKHRGKGSRGGKGMAGTGKRADTKKPTIINLYGNDYFGKRGFIVPASKPYTAINIRDLNVLIAKHSLKGEINLKKYGYGKLLSTGELHTAIKITVKRASKQCIEKVKNAGGSIVVENSKE